MVQTVNADPDPRTRLLYEIPVQPLIDATVAAHVALSDPHTQYQKESEKDAANGYAGLSAGSKLTGSQQSYGSSANTACEGNDSRLSDSRAPTGAAGGVLSGTYPNPGFAVDMATQAELDAVAASVIAGYVPTSRQVIAGTGLTGGGTLAADRTFTVAYGTSSSTACIGNDSRLSDSRAPNGSASGDLSGTYPSPTVAKLAGVTPSAYGLTLIDDTDAATARTTLGLVIGTNVQAYDAELAALAGLTSAADKGIQFTGSGTAATYDLTTAGKALLDDADATAQRTTLGLGTIATQAANSVSISGGSITGITDLAVADGGTGASTAAAARTNLGSTTVGDAVFIAASTAAARTAIGAVIGTDVQAYDAELAAIAGLTSAANKGIQFTGSGTAATFDLTTAGKALLDDAAASDQRTTLGLGTIATQAASNVAITGGAAALTSNLGLTGTGSDTIASAPYFFFNTGSGAVSAMQLSASNHLDIWSNNGTWARSARIQVTGEVLIYATTDSTSTSTGALQCSGGGTFAKYLTLDGGAGKTLRYTNGTANASVATTLGSVGPTGSTAGNPQGWARISINGTDRYIPYW